MSQDIIAKIRENVIQGRTTAEDEGMDESLTGPGVTELVKQAIAEKIDLQTIIKEVLTGGMSEVGKKFEAGEYYIPDMLASAESVGAAMEILKPYLASSGVQSNGTVLMATVKGDLHDIGKNIVSVMLRGIGYTVTDLGNDIETDTIVEAVRDQQPQFLGLSALLTSTMQQMDTVIKALEAAKLRESVKVIVGGAPVSEEFAKKSRLTDTEQTLFRP
jgi:5-methyltetrahydrofolate--homocysteine methyltransferase